MAKCVNCGKRIPADREPRLCERCAACETIYDAVVVSIRRRLALLLRSCGIYAGIGVLLLIAQPFSGAKIAGTVALYFALINGLLSGTQCLSQYLQLRRQAKTEREQSTDFISIKGKDEPTCHM